MEYTYTFYELGYIEYLWYFIFSLYYKFLEYPLMIRICSVVLTVLILIIPISYITLFVRNQILLQRKRNLEKCREKYSATFRKILIDENNIPAEIVREKISDARGKNSSSKFTGKELNLIVQILKEKIQNYNERNLNRHNYQQILTVLNIAGWLEDTIEKSGVSKCIQCFQTAQMLVTVEDITGNYSSAICYINELLETNPYWEGLWRKKIELYKKQGNTVESNRLFKRLQQIYPNNTQIKDAYYYELELEYKKQKEAGNLVAAGDALRELVRINPKNVDYQIALINHYYNAHLLTKAIDQASVALAENPGNITLLRKKVGILEETGQHSLAMDRVTYFINSGYNTPAARALYNELLLETARQSRDNEPYNVYGKIYARDKSNREALDFLLNTAIIRKYHQDAIYYLREAKRVYGTDNKRIRYMEYELYR